MHKDEPEELEQTFNTILELYLCFILSLMLMVSMRLDKMISQELAFSQCTRSSFFGYVVLFVVVFIFFMSSPTSYPVEWCMRHANMWVYSASHIFCWLILFLFPFRFSEIEASKPKWNGTKFETPSRIKKRSRSEFCRLPGLMFSVGSAKTLSIVLRWASCDCILYLLSKLVCSNSYDKQWIGSCLSVCPRPGYLFIYSLCRWGWSMV